MLENAIDYLRQKEYEIIELDGGIWGISLTLVDADDAAFDIEYVRDMLPVEEYVIQNKNQFVMISHLDDTPFPIPSSQLVL